MITNIKIDEFNYSDDIVQIYIEQGYKIDNKADFIADLTKTIKLHLQKRGES